ncbi:glycosyltransferase family 90 protein [Tortispora caseinolytica NRRL Y-17796]|uniref:Glycosyltransferase family 90 protein n=1 Tax=Tortispora caseinolytica NRRL Y-17796 TaxID=767744 RepID=A0A1E4TAZ6_9ASCO|nr:glycosyltransferase family 90 protein [Tortispora caseinolytica NRRL Y-17796]
MVLLLSSESIYRYTPKISLNKNVFVEIPETLADFDRYADSIVGEVESSDPVTKLYFDAYLNRRPSYRRYTLKEYALKYQRQHGRAPPPGFDKWFKFALEKGCVDFDHFDAIYEDLELFWKVPASDIRGAMKGLLRLPYFASVSVKDGEVSSSVGGYRVGDVNEMVRSIAQHLPDMEFVLNLRDEPRVMLPDKLIQELRNSKNGGISYSEQGFLPITSDTYSHSLMLEDHNEFTELTLETYTGKDTFSHAFISCPEDSPLRKWIESELEPSEIEPLYKYRGLIRDFEMSKDLCTVGPLIHDKHGFLSAPATLEKVQKLAPVFSVAKTSLNQDIRIPGDKYIVNTGSYGYDEHHDIPWANKSDIMLWRGVPTGGIYRPDSSAKIHRPVLIDHFNWSYPYRHMDTVLCETRDKFGRDDFTPCNVQMSAYLKEHADVGFYSIECNECDFLREQYAILPTISSTDQYTHKYLIDIDGHSFSARFKAFLESRSLPFKATIFKEWHDSRITPWLHFIPLDNTLDDALTLLTYFTGMEGVIEPHEGLAERIAQNGREHASLVLRQEDVQIYMLLLLLEYARLMDDNRDRIGYIYREN